MVKDVLREAKADMEKAIESIKSDLMTMRTGRASSALVDRVMVDYYGTPTSLRQLAAISTPEPQLLTVRPFDPGSLKEIERAILSSDLGLTPNNDGRIIRLVVPPLSEERRIDLVKLVKRRIEEAKVSVRHARRDALENLREFEKEKMITEDEFYRGRDNLQELTDSYIEETEDVGNRKEKDILEI